ncbi:MAG: sugar phosphate isomerase [Anaerocolumna sp.]|jgi:sugar phosphate isomerase/epimerase|nr:sugar phosphate isomerase [Anaerocolumna sp.]
MSQVKIGIQAMMIKNSFVEIGPYESLKKISELGYSVAELSQVPMDQNSVLEMKRACKDFNMEIAAISGNLEFKDPTKEALNTTLDKFIGDCKLLNCNYIRIGMLPYSCLATKDTLLEFCREAEKVAVELEKHEIKLYYHNHHFEMQKLDGQTILEIIEQTAPHLGFELDVHWLQRGGLNPIDAITHFNRKVDLLHLKDYRIKNIPREICEQSDYRVFSEYFDHCIEFAEFGEGNLNMQGIIAAGIDAGCKYFLIEQDNSYDKTPYESLEITITNLKKMGYSKFL